MKFWLLSVLIAVGAAMLAVPQQSMLQSITNDVHHAAGAASWSEIQDSSRTTAFAGGNCVSTLGGNVTSGDLLTVLVIEIDHVPNSVCVNLLILAPCNYVTGLKCPIMLLRRRLGHLIT